MAAVAGASPVTITVRTPNACNSVTSAAESERGGSLSARSPASFIAVCRPAATARTRKPCPSSSSAAAAALVGLNPVMLRQDRIDHRLGSLDRIFPGEQRAIAGHGVAEQAFVGRFLFRLLVNQVEFALVADELLPRAFDAGGKRD